MPFGDNDWLALTQEETLEPEIPICDPHHHMWDRRPARIPYQNYMLDQLYADLNSGHNLRSTVFIETRAMYRVDGPEEMRPVGEVEFVQGMAAAGATGLYGPAHAAASIVGHANLNLGDGAAPVLEALQTASPNRFRGIRHGLTWDPDPRIPNGTYDRQGQLAEDGFRAGARGSHGTVFRRLAILPPIARVGGVRQGDSGLDHHPQPYRWDAEGRSLRQ